MAKISFEKLRISLASPEVIKKWSYGEVRKPETINYRTLKPEKDGLFCEKIFGPIKDWECHCGKYKRIRYKNIKCEACGVEVTQTKVRRERMGHIVLAAPVSHIWYFKGTPSRMSYLLGITVKELERVLYYGDYMVTRVNKDGIAALLDKINQEKINVKRLMPTFFENAARLDVIESEDEEPRTVITNVKVCDSDLSREQREDIQNSLKRLQGRFAEDSAVELRTIKGKGGALAIHVYKNFGAEEKMLGYLPQAYSKIIAPIIAAQNAGCFADVERITKGIIDRRRLGIRLHLRFDDEKITRSTLENLETRFHECEDVYASIYLDEGLSLLRSLEVKQTLQTGMVGNTYRFPDGRVFKSEDRLLEEVFELDFYVPKEYDKLQTLVRYLADAFNDSSIYNLFSMDMGAQAIRDVLSSVNLNALADELREELKDSKRQKRLKLIKRLTVVEAFRKSNNRPDWMILDILPVLPPDLRPMVQLEGGRFASSDLNDLYRRTINRNNRLRKLIEIKAPESIIRNEKRMLQEAVDALIDNGRRGRVFTGSHKRALKSLSDLLKGKQGRFRQNLLGKRVDYSGRSVIVIGPELNLHQCGIPKEMALELFKPFVMHELVKRGVAPNIKSAKKIVERVEPEVWDVLEEVTAEHPVLLNRAPTLHRLGIQAFMPVLVEGKAIQIHPLVCAAFNADFDGDQMAVHVPLSMEAQAEAKLIMLATHNLLLPANGKPVVAPTQDIVLGCYYLTLEKEGAKGQGKPFRDTHEVTLAYELGAVSLHAKVKVRINGKTIETTPGRVIFNSFLPKGWGFENTEINKKELSRIIAGCLRRFGNAATVELLDNVKTLGFRFATQSGLTISVDDIKVPGHKKQLLEEADHVEKDIDRYYMKGLMTEDERYRRRVELWLDRTEKIAKDFEDAFLVDKFNPLFMMARSGARGTVQQIRQLAGLRGLMQDPTGKIIDFPIKTNFREGLTVLEYFISTHGARKGLADTALRTADSGYLTRRLVDVAQDMIIQEIDCRTARSVSVDSVSRSGEEIELARELKIKDLKLTKKKPYQIREPKSYPFDSTADLYPTLVMKGDRKKISLRKIYPVRDDCGLVVDVKADSRTTHADFLVVDMPSFENSIRDELAEKIIGRTAAADIFSLATGEVFVKKGAEILEEDFERMSRAKLAAPIRIRSVLECQTRHGVCATCYGRNFATGRRAEIGDAIGIIAAQSIGEPGTQLTMRTFHTGGVSGEDISDITQGLPRVEELFEARRPRHQALMSETDGKVEIVSTETGREIVLTPSHRRDGAKKERLKLMPESTLLVKNGAKVRMGQRLTDGHLNPHDVLRIMGISKTQQYIVNEIIAVYKSQGVETNEKHVEIIVREMIRKIRVESPGDTDLLPHALVDRFEFDRINREIKTKGARPAVGKPILLGITKCSLSTHSFLSAASFQETTRVLTDAAVKGKMDPLMGLKENVIIGNLIPAGTGLPMYRDVEVRAKEVERPEEEKEPREAQPAGALTAEE
ncbi:MAG: DNA-directed RNA polymerase subunit beta' [bacterium]